MLFNYKKLTTPIKVKKLSIILAYFISCFLAISTAYALNGTSLLSPLTAQQINQMIKQTRVDDQSFHITATPEVVEEINNIRSSEQARTFLRASLQRMKSYQSLI